MKKITFILLMVSSVVTVSSQTPLTTAVDFTATDVEGHEHNLFQVLDGGQYVLIDFFFTSCVPCQTIAPMINESYRYFGCNTADVVFWSIDNGDTDAECIAFDETYGVEYPTFSGVEGGGDAICDTYQIGAYPTVILIAPDHNIVAQDIWPIDSSQDVIDVLEGHGIAQHDCSVGTSDIEHKQHDVCMCPNPAGSLVEIELMNAEDRIRKIEIIDNAGKVVAVVENIQASNKNLLSIDITDLYDGLYFVRMFFTDNQIITNKININKK